MYCVYIYVYIHMYELSIVVVKQMAVTDTRTFESNK